MKKNLRFCLGFSLLMGAVTLFFTNFASAVDCWQYSGGGYGGNQTACTANGCMWSTPTTDAWCSNDDGCCQPNECYQFAGQGATNCTANSKGLNCTYDSYMQIYLPNGSLWKSGGCVNNYNAGGGGGNMSWGGMSEGCWQNDGNYGQCTNMENIAKCSWKENGANQNPWCWIKTLSDATMKNSVATSADIGCCQQKGCMDYDGNETACWGNTAFKGLCEFANTSFDSYCPNAVGCCRPKWCGQIYDSTNCSKMKTSLYMSCKWNSGSGVCEPESGGGFTAYNDTDSCMSKGGWWNSTGGCEMPSGGSAGGGGFMFGEAAHCWFADNQPDVCKNITGCIYCNASDVHFNVSRTSGTLNESSGCYGGVIGLCKGHESAGFLTSSRIDIMTNTLNCTHILIRSACEYGPLPNCVWQNSSAKIGTYCAPGATVSQRATPPVPFCEHPDAKDNYTLCNKLAQQFMMPCKWGNFSANLTANDNCTFNGNAVFGAATGASKDYNTITNEVSCVAAGGTWKKDYYVDTDGSLKQDAWCEKGAMFSFGTGQAFANKGNCDSDCWACEFNSSGSNYGKSSNATVALALAQQACIGSRKGVCVWKNDTTAPNQLGWCDYPKEFEFGGAKDCSTDCKACEFFVNPRTACMSSSAGCNWVNDTTLIKGGYCASSSKKSCLTECFSCYSQTECANSTYHPTMNCSWDSSFNLCKPLGFTGEICFNALDDDGDSKTDCADSDCTYDQFCGGGSIGGGVTTDCKKRPTQNDCKNTRTTSGINCTWISPIWGGSSYCDYPGTDCWMFDTNISACRKDTRGCIYRNASGGYPNGTSVQVPVKAFPGFCEINKTKSDACYNATTSKNSSTCSSSAECTWVTDSYSSIGGRCEFRPFAMCGNNTDATSCNLLSNWCGWRNNSFSLNGGGFCEPKCGGLSSATCTGFCQWKSSICEPEAFGGMEGGGMGSGGIGGGFGCHMNDGNYTNCLSKNMTCSWENFTMGTTSMGICNEKGAQMMFESMDMSPPKMLGWDPADASPSEIDIREYGIKDMTKSLAFGIVVTNISNASVCKGYYVGGGFGVQPTLGAGTGTTKFYWFLDTNKNTADGCNATMQNGSKLSGFEFLIKYVVSMVNGTVTETKSFHKCSSGNWILTNVPLTSNRKFMCGMSMGDRIGGVMIIVDKESFESFLEYNKTAPMRVFISSGHNDTFNENRPLDSVGGAGYYTYGSADFKFIDCSNPDTKDEKCKNFNKFGFNVFEDCKNGKDDDSDGKTDCADVKCGFMPICAGSGGAFNFTANANDKESPSIAFSNVDLLHNAAFIKFDSNEPANGSITFYANDSECSNANITINDLGDVTVSFDDYKPFHLITLDSTTLPGYITGLVNETTYYYKTRVCDPSNNCAESSCLNFTTKSLSNYKNFIFKMKLAPGFNVSIPALNYSGNFTTPVGGKVYEAGVKTNASVTRNINITVNCGNQSLTLVGVDILKPKSIDMTGAFLCDAGNNASIGMNSTSKAWDQAISDLGMGGGGDYLKLSFPVDYVSGNNITWCNDDGNSNCSIVKNYANCSSGGTSKTDCKVPTSLGFSVYKVVSTSGTTTTTTDSSSSSGGGGSLSKWTTIVVTKADFEKGYTRSLRAYQRLQANITGEKHYIGITSILADEVDIEVSSTTQTATLKIGETKKFDVADDGFYDVSVLLNSITGDKKMASITIKPINEKVVESGSATPTPTASSSPSSTPSQTGEQENGEETESGSFLWIVIIGVIIIAAVIGALIWFKSQRRRRRGY